MCAGATEGSTGFPGALELHVVWATRHGCWKQDVPLTAKPSLQPQEMVFS